MKYIPLTFHLQTMADLYEKLSSLSNFIQASDVVDSVSSNQSTQNDNAVNGSQSVTPQKDKATKRMQKCKSHKHKDVISECEDCNQVFETKVQNKRGRKPLRRQNKEKKKNRINGQKLKKLKHMSEEISLQIEENNDENNLEISIDL